MPLGHRQRLAGRGWGGFADLNHKIERLQLLARVSSKLNVPLGAAIVTVKRDCEGFCCKRSLFFCC